MRIVFFIASLLVLGMGGYLAVAAYRLRRVARLQYEQILWIQDQAQRALTQMQSKDPDTVVTGLQNLRALTDPNVALEALETLEKLIQSSNHDIAEQARATHRKMVSSLKRSRAVGAD
ncbi:MAG: hypothetical protein ACJ74G_04555 [Blastocatellia bacterium]